MTCWSESDRPGVGVAGVASWVETGGGLTELGAAGGDPDAASVSRKCRSS